MTKSRGAWTRKLPISEQHLTLEQPVLIGAIADTHMSSQRAWAGLEAVKELFARAGVSFIVHAGDAGEDRVLSELATVAPVAAVRGNADPLELIERLPDRVWIDVGTRRLLLLHGHHGKTALTAARTAAGPGIDLIVFGHSHKPLIETHNATILFNPGSATERRWNPHFGAGLIRVSDESIDPELVLFDDPARLHVIEF
jgi:putative phosphoesterase